MRDKTTGGRDASRRSTRLGNRFSIEDGERGGETWDYFDPTTLVCLLRPGHDHEGPLDRDERDDMICEADRYELDRRPDRDRARALDEYGQFGTAARAWHWC